MTLSSFSSVLIAAGLHHLHPHQRDHGLSGNTGAAECESTADDTGIGIKGQQTAAASSESSAAETVEITISDSDDYGLRSPQSSIRAGLVSSDTEFQTYISNMGKESSLKSGTFQIPKGSTDEQILNIIAN